MRKKRDGTLSAKIMDYVIKNPGCTLTEIRREDPYLRTKSSLNLAVKGLQEKGLLKAVDGDTCQQRRWFHVSEEKPQSEEQDMSDGTLQKYLDEHIFSPASEEDLLAHLMDAVSKIVDFKVKKEKDRYYDEIEELKLKIAKLEREKDPYLQKIFG